MEPIKSTAEILAFKVLNRNIDNTWVTWAIDMVMEGFSTEYLLILAGQYEQPFNQFQLQALVNKVLNELHLDYSNKDQVIKNYVCYLVGKALKNEVSISKVLYILSELYFEVGRNKYLYDFYALHNAKEDLLTSDMQWYWEGANKNNIDKIIVDYFTEYNLKCLGDNDSSSPIVNKN